MSVPEPYRGVTYSIYLVGGDRWLWRLHRKLEDSIARPLVRGETHGTQDDAIAAAKAAIDRELDGGSN